MPTACIICGSPATTNADDPQYFACDCPRCGRWDVATSWSALDFKLKRLDDQNGGSAMRVRSQLSHILRRQHSSNVDRRATVPVDLATWRLDEVLPSPAELLDNLVLLIGTKQSAPEEWVNVPPDEASAWIGATINVASSRTTVSWLMETVRPIQLIERGANTSASLRVRLTFAGWEKYAALQRGRAESRVVLMAMQFHEPEMASVYSNCFVPAVARAGFELRTVTEKQGAGLIDDQLRVALRRSRFVVVDISHGNKGAYWEGGFAEGLGRPVIYTCRQDAWDAKTSHFDTNHLVTVVWDSSDLDDAGRRLTATIRATLPDEAAMEDN